MAHDSFTSLLPAGAGVSKMVLRAAALVIAAALAGCATKGSHSGADGNSYASGRGGTGAGGVAANSAAGGGRGGPAAGGHSAQAGGTGGVGGDVASLNGDGGTGGAGGRAGAGRAVVVGPDGTLVGPDGQPVLGPDGQTLHVGPDGQTVVGPDGQPVLGSDGQPLRVGPDGQTVVGSDGQPLRVGPDGQTLLSGDDSDGAGGSTKRSRRAGAGAGGGGVPGAGGDVVAGVGGAGSGGDAMGGESGRRAAGPGGRGSRPGVGGAGGEDDPMIVGMVDAPGGSAQVDEDVTPQTLGGMLPMVVGVDEQGQFDFDQAVLRSETRALLDDLAGRLQGAEYDRLDIVGFTDRIGTDQYNQQLSERRAWAVARYLMQQGVPLAKIRVQGRGERESLLSVTECADLGREDMIACFQKDRRVQIEASIRKSHVKIE